jgi:hypothetical protein
MQMTDIKPYMRRDNVAPNGAQIVLPCVFSAIIPHLTVHSEIN